MADERVMSRMRIRNLAQARVTYGYCRLHVLFRQEWLNENWFLSLEDKVESWRIHYNGDRLHSTLENLTLREYAVRADIGD